MTTGKTIRYYVAYGLTWLVFLCLLNAIIDSPIISRTSINGYNEMESIAEWVTEDLLEIENAFPENDDEEDAIEKKTQHAAYDWETNSSFFVSFASINSPLFYSSNKNNLLSRSVAIVAPPPDLFS